MIGAGNSTVNPYLHISKKSGSIDLVKINIY